jgi:putative SbcD/Mre11-related phosphoesterase
LSIPIDNFNETYLKLESSIKKIKFTFKNNFKIVINGDLKDSIKYCSKTTSKRLKLLVEMLSKYGEVILIKGNHDSSLEYINHIELRDYYLNKNVLITHGHKKYKHLILKTTKLIILAHQHPAVEIKDNLRKETFKSFLINNENNVITIIIPSFVDIFTGYDVLNNGTLIPDIKSFDKYKCLLISEEIKNFGYIKNLKTIFNFKNE